MHLKKLKPLVFALFAVLLLFPAAVSAQELAKEQIIRIAVPVRDIQTLDPAYSTLTGEKTIVSEITNGLLRMPYGVLDLESIEGDLAESWTVSGDGLTWDFTLRQGVKWHKGYGEVTAEDVKFSLERVMDPATGSPWAKKYSNIDAISTDGAYGVSITLKDPDPFFSFALLGYQGGQIISRKAVMELGKDIAFNPVGSGPFMFESYKKGQSLVLRRNPDYFMGAPILETVEYVFIPDDSSRMLALQKGEIDLGRGVRRKEWAERAERFGLVLMPPNPPQQLIVAFNMKRKPLDNLKVRQALAHAIDRDIYVDLFGPVLGGPQNSPVPPGYFGHLEEVPEELLYRFDPVKARKLLAEAGYPNGFDLGDVVMSETESYLQPTQIMQEQLRQVGVNFTLKVVDHPTYHKLIREDVNPLVIYGGVRLPIASTILTQFYHSKSGVGKDTAVTNFSHYEGIDTHLDKAEKAMTLEEKKELFEQAQIQILKDLPAYPLALNRVSMTRQKWVDLGYPTDPYETLYYVIEVSEKTRILKH
ncbi:MAG: ABC transporter substrate-binding protein [Desulfohalobiaceae bacterium]